MSFCKGKSEKLRWRKEQLDTAFLFEDFARCFKPKLQIPSLDPLVSRFHGQYWVELLPKSDSLHIVRGSDLEDITSRRVSSCVHTTSVV